MRLTARPCTRPHVMILLGLSTVIALAAALPPSPGPEREQRDRSEPRQRVGRVPPAGSWSTGSQPRQTWSGAISEPRQIWSGQPRTGAFSEPRSRRAGRAAQAHPGIDSPNPVPVDPLAHREIPRDPWTPRPAVAPAGAIEHCGPWVRGPFESIQVNVDENGCNIVGDATNEPSIAVDPTNPDRIVIGWRQFDTVGRVPPAAPNLSEKTTNPAITA